MAGRRVDPGYCLFLTERMTSLIPQLREEIGGVRAGADIEAVHRMRVASRRLRTVLPLYAGCAGKGEFRRWRREIRSVTRALGAARDADVQLEFLVSYAASLPGEASDTLHARLPAFAEGSLPPGGTFQPPPEADSAPGGSTVQDTRFPRLRAAIRRLGLIRARRGQEEPARPPAAVPEPPAREGIDCLLLRLGQHRAALQPAVIEALDRLERSGVLEAMADRLRERTVRARLAGASARSEPAYAAAHLNAALRYEELIAHAAALRDPARVSEHHAMRIAAKRLRYTLETFAPLYDDELRGELKAMKRLQENLGQLHDCDVWIDDLPRFLDEEWVRTVAYFGHGGFFYHVEPGVRRLLADRRAERERLHAATLAGWEELERDRFFERLLDRLARARDEALLPPAPLRPIAEGEGTARIALIADVHGNLSALEAVVRDAEARGAQAFVGAGDMVGNGGDTGGVVHRLAGIGSVLVRGETDRRVVRAAHRAGPAEIAMSAADLAYLEGLPAERRFTLRGTRFLVVYRYPRRGKEQVGPTTTDDTLARLAGSADAEIVVVGHTHRPFSRTANRVRFVNPGSVGRADAGGGVPRAEYALLQLFPFDLSLLSVPYGAPGADRVTPAGERGDAE